MYESPIVIVIFVLTIVIGNPISKNEIPEWNTLIYGYSSLKCYAIPEDFALCKNIGYTRMILPNFLQHESIAEATSSSKDWQKFTKINCHNDTRRFLCSLYAPVCVPNEPVRKIQPCKELCLNVKKACSPSMLNYGYKWPDILHCDKFPLKTAGLCIRGTEGSVQNVITPSETSGRGCDCKSLFGSMSITDRFCSATTVIRAKISNMRDSGNSKYTIRLHRKSKIIKANSTDLPFIHEIEVPCLCDQIDGDKIRKGRWLLMGIVRDRTFTLTSLTKWKKKNKDFRKIIRKLKKFESKVCGSQFRPSDRRMAGLSINGERMKEKNRKTTREMFIY